MPVGQHIRESACYAALLARRPLLWLLLAALNLVPIANFIALGYYARAASAGDLPPLRPLRRAFVLGVKIFAVLLAYGFIIFFAAMYAYIAVILAAPQSMPLADRLLAAFAALFGTAALLALALGVPVALPAAARYGAAKALNPAHSWRIIRGAGLAEYLAFSAAAALLSVADELLLYVAWALAGLPGLVATLIAVILAAPLIYLMLWKWAGLILEMAEQRIGTQDGPASGSVRAFKPAVVCGAAV